MQRKTTLGESQVKAVQNFVGNKQNVTNPGYQQGNHSYDNPRVYYGFNRQQALGAQYHTPVQQAFSAPRSFPRQLPRIPQNEPTHK